VLNPASVFYLVQIVLAALVLGRMWAWIVAALSVAGYAMLFLAPIDELRAAQVMHPEIALHMRGMWIAFAVTALVIAVMVTRLAAAVERRDRVLETLRDRGARAARAQSLATVVAGAAHELSTPLATMAVAARELERAIEQRGGHADHANDARLIRAEIDRCRVILDQMAARVAEPMGEAPASIGVDDVIARTIERLPAADRARVDATPAPGLRAIWPASVMDQALGNLVRNALQASSPNARVTIAAAGAPGDRVRIVVTDRGAGMTRDQLARAGEPFYTTKPAGAGTGLGLYVTRSSVEPLGGELHLASTPGEGTTATIELPRDVLAPREAPHD
jgi:two-component system sensor histidine kinase RegB